MVQWQFENWEDFASHLEKKAAGYRENAERFAGKSLRRSEFIARAAESESIAYIVRHMEFKST